MKLTNEDFSRLQIFMNKNYGINLENKKVLVETRLATVVKKMGYDNFKDYIDDLLKDKTGEYASKIVEKLTTNYTYFMREEIHFEFLQNSVILPALKRLPVGGLKIWCAASSSGEEAYCIAMLAASIFRTSLKSKISIVASDISKNVLKQAKDGIYSEEKITKLPPKWINNYMQRLDSKNYQIKDEIKDLIDFRYFNLNQNVGWESKKYDVIFCRNVMIYFDNPTKQNLCRRLYDSLKPGGYLIIGLSENLSSLDTEFVRVKPSVYKKNI
jgi:chemotaxis protein methyltransferase CheR